MTPHADSVAAYDAVQARMTTLLRAAGREPAVERLCLLPARATALAE